MTPRLHLSPLEVGEYPLTPDQSHYLLNVLRCRIGEKLIIFDGNGLEADSVLLCNEGQQARVRVDAIRVSSSESPQPPIVLQGLCLGDKMDWVIQKATELGAGAIWPISADRSQMKLDGARAEKKLAHWRAVAEASAMQCGRARLPSVQEPLNLAAVLQRLGTARENCAQTGAHQLAGWILDPGAENSVANDLTRVAEAETPWILAVGPESGWSPRELETARGYGLTPARMGPRVLRTETAALVGLTLVAQALGEFGG